MLYGEGSMRYHGGEGVREEADVSTQMLHPSHPTCPRGSRTVTRGNFQNRRTSKLGLCSVCPGSGVLIQASFQVVSCRRVTRGVRLGHFDRHQLGRSQEVGHPIDSGMGLSITIDKIRKDVSGQFS
jgi:hypothetical protein